MSGPEPATPDRLGPALSALHLAQLRWLDDCDRTLAANDVVLSTARRWLELLGLVRLQLHRVEHRLGDRIIPPGPTPPGMPFPELDPAAVRATAVARREALHRWLAEAGILTTYRRVEDVLDLDQDAENADAVTDLGLVVEAIGLTRGPLTWLHANRHATGVDAVAFTNVIAPWRRTGAKALSDSLRWLEALRDEGTDW